MSLKSVMQHSFENIPSANIQRSVFNRDHGLKTAFNVDYLIPIYVDEMLPGDTFHLTENLFGRLSTPIKPFMDNLFLETFYFVVPNRVLWQNWTKFNGEQDSPADSTDFLVPCIDGGEGVLAAETIYDYMGLPTEKLISDNQISALPLRAYNKIWNDWFRDQNLQNSLVENFDDGPDNMSDYTLKKRNKRPDYFTSCLPWAQKGEPVQVPLGGTIPVFGNGKSLGITTDGSKTSGRGLLNYFPGSGSYTQLGVSGNTIATSTYNRTLPWIPSNTETTSLAPRAVGIVPFPLESGMYADLSESTSTTINALRTAFQLQRLLERDARGGTRYVEMIKSHFGVTSPDFRLQRSEYLGGGHYRININPVQQTSESGNTPQGNLSAYGVLAGSKGGYSYSATEHMTVIGLACVRADLTYQQGLDKMWSRRKRFDYYYPALANLGEQAVLNKEIFYSGTDVLDPQEDPMDENVFGYQERWAEYRYKRSQITGKMRSTYPQSLDVWHLSEEFADVPALNSTFIEQTTPIERVITFITEPQILLDCLFELKSVRPMPTYSVPGLIDHF